MNKFEKQQRELLDKLTETNNALDRIASLLVSTQLLTECVSPDGEARDAETCAEIVTDSYNAGMCLHQQMKSDQKDFQYQVNEFYIGGKDDEDDEDEGPAPEIAIKF